MKNKKEKPSKAQEHKDVLISRGFKPFNILTGNHSRQGSLQFTREGTQVEIRMGKAGRASVHYFGRRRGRITKKQLTEL